MGEGAISIMSNYIEHKDKITFHPGYYLKETVDELGFLQGEFAKRLDISPELLGAIINGDQCVSPNIALKLSEALGTSAQYWLNLQSMYDAALADAKTGATCP